MQWDMQYAKDIPLPRLCATPQPFTLSKVASFWQPSRMQLEDEPSCGGPAACPVLVIPCAIYAPAQPRWAVGFPAGSTGLFRADLPLPVCFSEHNINGDLK